MFEKIKNMFSSSKLEYFVEVKTFEEYLKKELEFSLENNLELCTDLKIFYKGETPHVNIWNFSAAISKSDQEKELSVIFDDIEYNTIDNLINNATIANTKLVDFKEYFVIKLTYSDSEFLNNYKQAHQELNVEDYI